MDAGEASDAAALADGDVEAEGGVEGSDAMEAHDSEVESVGASEGQGTSSADSEGEALFPDDVDAPLLVLCLAHESSMPDL